MIYINYYRSIHYFQSISRFLRKCLGLSEFETVNLFDSVFKREHFPIFIFDVTFLLLVLTKLEILLGDFKIPMKENGLRAELILGLTCLMLINTVFDL